MFGKGKNEKNKVETKATEMGKPKKLYPITARNAEIETLISKLNANLEVLREEEKKEVTKNAAKEVKTFSLVLKENISLTENGIKALETMQSNTTASEQQLKILEKIESGLDQKSRTRAMISDFFKKINYISETPHTFKLETKGRSRG